MQAYRVVVPQNHVVRVDDFEPPALAPDEVLIASRVTLISPGTERAFYVGLPNASQPFPYYPGYSNVGQVIALGAAVERLKLGERVISPSPHASHVIAKADKCLPIPEGVSDEDAVFFNLIAIAMQAIHKARIELGESVIVLGAGMIGLFAMQLARLSGGLPLIVLDLDAKRLDLALRLGADSAYRVDNFEGEAKVVIEASGAAPAVKTAFQRAAQRGRVLLLGSSRDETDGINFYRDVHRKGITIIGAHEINRPTLDNAPGFWRQIDEQRIALDLLARGRIRTDNMISHRFAAQDFPQAYEQLLQGGGMGMLIEWEGTTS